jgi:hypothetical protein
VGEGPHRAVRNGAIFSAFFAARDLLDEVDNAPAQF